MNEGTDRNPDVGHYLCGQAQRTYLSSEGNCPGDVIRMDLLFDIDPFSRDSIELARAEDAIRDALPQAFAVLLAEATCGVAKLRKLLMKQARKSTRMPLMSISSRSLEIVAKANEMAAIHKLLASDQQPESVTSSL
ncbi:MAG: hypothetical protein R3B91_13650 [Planctomycetaceae bacterium]